MPFRNIILFLLFYCIPYNTLALQLIGKVTDEKGDAVPFCSILIKGTKFATLSNSAGDFFIDLPAGTYTITCQHVGFKPASKKIELTESKQIINFTLIPSEITLEEIVVRQGDEDPAYDIIRQAIKNRKYHKDIIEKIPNYDVILSIGGDNYCYGEQPGIYEIDRCIKKAGKKLVLWGASIGQEDLSTAKIEDLKFFK